MNPHCDGISESCPCSECTRLFAFKKAPWYLTLRQNSETKPFFQNNDPVPAEQVPPLRAHQLGIMDEIEKVEQDILRVQNYLEELEAHRDVLEELGTDAATMLSPIRRLPYDVIQEIFMMAAAGSTPVLSDRRTSIANGPWKLGHVCRLWREVALGCQSLWSEISAHYFLGDPNGQDGLVAKIEEGVKRAGMLGLQVAVVIPSFRMLRPRYWASAADDNAPQASVPFSAVQHLLAEHSSRFLTFNVTAHFLSDLHSLLEYSQGFESLTSLSFTIEALGSAFGDDTGTRRSFPPLRVGPSLSAVDLHGFYHVDLQEVFQEFDIPLQGINIFRCSSVKSQGDIWFICRQCPELTTLDVSLRPSSDFPLGTVSELDGEIRHENLVHMAVPTSEVLDRLTTPALQRLRLRSNHERRDYEQVLANFLSRSKCNLSALLFRLPPNSPSPSVNIMTYLDSLRILILEVESPNVVLEELSSSFKLARTESHRFLLPHLEVLVIGGHSDNSYRSYSESGHYQAAPMMELLTNMISIRVDTSNSNSSPDKCSTLKYLSFSPLDTRGYGELFDLHDDTPTEYLESVFEPYNDELNKWIEGGLRLVLHHHLLIEVSNAGTPYFIPHEKDIGRMFPVD